MKAAVRRMIRDPGALFRGRTPTRRARLYSRAAPMYDPLP